MADKVRFGLRNVKYAVKSQGSYGTPVDWAGAVSMTLSTEGSDSEDFYADDGIYYSFGGTNGGYTVELEMARITDAVRIALLGESTDSTSGAQFEYADVEPAEFALLFECQGDEGPIGFAFYGCKASRPALNANTKGETPSVDTETLSIRVAGEDIGTGASKRHVIQGHIEKTAANTAKYTAFFASVVLPAANVSA
jgi:phi13 family phage major tail protein